MLECEYGYGPVVPCQIYLGQDEIGLVTQVGRQYYLQTQYANKKIKLENTYLKALEEAVAIIEAKLKS